MKKNTELFIGVCTTKSDFEKYQQQLLYSLKNLYFAFKKKCVAYIVLQNHSSSDFSYDFSDEEWIFVLHTQYMGVSNARNLCVDAALRNKAKFIIFHDASIYWSRAAAEFIFTHKEQPATPCVKVLFENRNDFNGVEKLPALKNKTFVQEKKNNPIYNSFVWSYLFKLKVIDGLRFDLNFGPGQDTKYKSGEDVLFLFEYFAKDKNIIISGDENVYVIHPPRPADFSKHLLYAYGQGALFRVLLKKYRDIRLLSDIVLFFGNAIFRCITFRRNAFPILIGRLKGFIGV